MTKRKAISKRKRFEILQRDGFRCQYCGARPSHKLLHVDHIIAVSLGGPTENWNLITACRDCNLGKTNLPMARLMLADCVLTPIDAKQSGVGRVITVCDVAMIDPELAHPYSVEEWLDAPFFIGRLDVAFSLSSGQIFHPEQQSTIKLSAADNAIDSMDFDCAEIPVWGTDEMVRHRLTRRDAEMYRAAHGL